MTSERLREDHPALDVCPDLADHGSEGVVVRLLLEDDESRDHVEAGLDHRRELAREDLQRPLLHFLTAAAGRVPAHLRQGHRAEAALA